MSIRSASAARWRGSTPSIVGPDGTPLPGGVASLERITLGDAEQWVLLRGHAVTNPVLLFVGGLGGPGMGQLRVLGGALEDRFTVVSWEHRGTGKSLAAGFPRTKLTVNQLTSDALELVAHLRKRFGQRKIFLVGRSLGTVLAVRMVQERPEWFHAYVGIGQLVNPTENDRLTWQYAVDAATGRADRPALRRLRRFGPPPYQGLTMAVRYAGLYRLGARYLGEDHGLPAGATRFGPLPAPEFTPLDRARRLVGAVRTFRTIYPRLRNLDLVAQASRVDVPVYLITGRDAMASRDLIERYHEALTAPRKELVRFDRSGSAPCFDEADRFNQLLLHRVLPDSTAAMS